MIDHELTRFRNERNAALRTLDLDYARARIPDASSDHVLLTGMHKARYECKDMPDELRHESGRWLRELGYRRIDGLELLPDGELAE